MGCARQVAEMIARRAMPLIIVINILYVYHNKTAEETYHEEDEAEFMIPTSSLRE